MSDQNYLYDMWITNIGTHTVTTLHNGNKTNTSVKVGANPYGVCIDLNKIVYVTNTKNDFVSKIAGGKRTDIPLPAGSVAYGICVDKTGVIAVSNSGLNSVSLIKNNAVIGTEIPVGRSPRGICADKNNTLFVANFLDNTVSVIKNGVKEADIPVGVNPYGICVDKNNTVWVTNHGSNTVSKIVNEKWVKDIPVGKCPKGICVDSKNVVWVSNASSNSVSTIVNSVKKEDIMVGTGPCGICIDKNGAVLVSNIVSGNVTRIFNGTKSNINLNDIPVSFGDATGMQAHLLFNPVDPDTTQKISFDDLNTELQTIITTGSSGGTIPTKIKADHVTFDDGTTLQSMLDNNLLKGDPGIDGKDGKDGKDGRDGIGGAGDAKTIMYDGTLSVAAALDKLLYIAPAITSFTNSVNTIEVGKTVTNITLNWTLNKLVKTQSIDNGGGVVPVGTITKSLTGLNITTNTNWTLTIDDGTVQPGHIVTKATGITFSNKRYWGVSPLSALTDAGILTLSSEFANSRAMTKTLNASGGAYLYVAMPTRFACDVNKFKIGGLYNSAWTLVTRSFVNASGYTESYDIFRSTALQNGSNMSVEIV